AFRQFDTGEGDDIYKITAAKIYHLPSPGDVDGDQRQVGKCIELACQFGGGLGAFGTMSKAFGVIVPESEALDAIRTWREAHPKIAAMWRELDNKARLCIRYGMDFDCGRVGFTMRNGHLYQTLPSGRELCYPEARVELADTKFGQRPAITFYGKNTYTNQWGRCQTYGGGLFQSCVQGLARDILYDALARLDEAGHRVVMHVHDEIVVESDALPLPDLEALMCVAPNWAEGLPLAAEGWEGERYRK
ncbi:MAG: hypothetical protein ACE5FI_19340, partial [Anaerolineales bacterium]